MEKKMGNEMELGLYRGYLCSILSESLLQGNLKQYLHQGHSFSCVCCEIGDLYRGLEGICDMGLL